MNNKTIRYPRQTAIAETTRKAQHKTVYSIENNIKVGPLTPDQFKKLSRTYFDLSGAYPYVFDAISYVCTHHKEKVELADDPRSLYYRITLSMDELFDYALDGYEDQKSSLLDMLIELMQKPQGKTVPISSTTSVSTIPLIVSFVREKMEDLTESKVTQLANIGSPQVIKSISIQVLKPLFYRLLNGENGENWFPLPKAFQAKLVHTLKENTGDSEAEKQGINGYASTYRRYFMYLNTVDNSESEKLILDSIDLWESIAPREVQKLKDGTKTLKRWETTCIWLHDANKIFNVMAQKGLLAGAKFAPTAVWYEHSLKTYTVHLRRRYFDGIKPLEDHIPIKALEHVQEKNIF
jgi:hypothetical protein